MTFPPTFRHTGTARRVQYEGELRFALAKHRFRPDVGVAQVARPLAQLGIADRGRLAKDGRIVVVGIVHDQRRLRLAQYVLDAVRREGVHQLCNFYGSTEVMGDVTYFVCESRKQLEGYEKVPIGYPLDNTTIYIMSPDLRPVRTEEIGELYVAGLNLAEGYVNGRDPDRFIDNPLAIDPSFSRLYKTGDYASVSKGCVYYQGRMDSQIKIRGHRVDLSEVEANLLGLAGVDKGIVLCYRAGEIDQALLGFVTLEQDAPFQTGLQVEAALGDKLAHYMIPQVVLLESIPLLVNGKIDRQTLLKMYESTNNNGTYREDARCRILGICN